MRIAVDAMGSESGPRAEAAAAALAAAEYGHEILLVGRQTRIEAELAKHNYDKSKVRVINANEVVGMTDSPAVSVRRKKDSSINIAFDLVKTKEADAVVSAGNTGAVVCAATLKLGLLRGIERPGIGILFPTLKNPVFMIDMGANINPKPIHLLQYGIMGSAFMKYIFNHQNPRVGLLNIGEEESKGTDFLKETRNLMVDSHLNFAGNMEGRDIFKGSADVIICDGFVGNVVLKMTESLAETFNIFLRRELRKNLISTIGAMLSMSAFNAMKKHSDWTEYGGAPLLGVDGRCIIAHGSSSPKALKNAIRVAGELTTHEVNRHIEEEMERAL